MSSKENVRPNRINGWGKTENYETTEAWNQGFYKIM